MQFNEIYEECGVFAIYNNNYAAINCILGLHAIQHRGQESFGIVTSDNTNFYSYYSNEQVNTIFTQQSKIDHLLGNIAIGHVRYSTSGSKTGMQPIILDCQFGKLAIAHNGNLINALQIRESLIKKGRIFSSDIDTEVIAHLIAMNTQDTILDNIIYALQNIKGAYSLVILINNTLVCCRDPYGIRPLVLGMLDNVYVIASETCALDIVGAQFVRDILPGELITINQSNTLTSYFPFEKQKSSFCIFEYVYFARPDSIMENKSVYEIRKNIGRELAIENPVPKDTNMVIPIPDSGVPAALGFAEYTNIPFEFGIIRNHYIGRTFIQPHDHIRNIGVKLKHNPNSSILKGKNIVLIDDSIVRGTTLKNIIALLHKAGVKQIHLRISSPPTIHSCFYGIDTPEESKLIANNLSKADIIKLLGCDSLHFLSINGLYKAICNTKRNNVPQYCDACFTGDYPIGKIDTNNVY
ncbi:amidophosphoribosyltransferase [Ehrlichia ruminantium]|uniref:Amidophosphoribosyltransferase n=2 Tax=Ehrlichia ruminantium TaxID=779 RepID=A0A0H3M523_EHRRW|nr:amidophosphoribosyltransferase [Ehrlichia ruminantium]QLK54764.1 amidophosphoribosyltransferase [Ehrlichia ruminantium]QLK55684.1 amidophosphoribosyltransferase [Ehrlichia ruminantium]UOD98876.1 amidophosphoribosyltransferase [Ehrlichia ruminantium]UOD99786.1 amidophosphoribosyltransferase [Ehrlichia ruminantium]CAH57805.1 glutamine phosphoribosylpyrophosphate amidotransferase [Ehrlichia ruminantium str. Welgevonden]